MICIGPVLKEDRRIVNHIEAKGEISGFTMAASYLLSWESFKIIRKLLGLDAKMRQYRDGANFCRAVMAEAGMSGLNKVWTSPETLPTAAEISNPGLWLTRMRPELTTG